MKNEMVQIKNPGDVPAGPHIAVLVYKTVNRDTGWGSSEPVPAVEHWVAPAGPDAASAVASFVTELELPGQYREKFPYVVLNVASKCAVTVGVSVKV